jgi:hypothetical protein
MPVPLLVHPLGHQFDSGARFGGLRRTRTVNRGVIHVPATLSVPAKLSNEAVKCRKCDAWRQTDHSI